MHVVHEPESLTTLLDATAEAIQVAVDDFGGTLKESLGHVRYVRQCPVEDVTAWHIVFETSEGLATLILVPGKQLDRVQSASLEGWSALARPTPRGYYVVVTASSQMTSRIDRIVQARVDFGT